MMMMMLIRKCVAVLTASACLLAHRLLTYGQNYIK